MGSDHQVWTDGSFRVPAIYLNDWPDRYIHTHADEVGNIDSSKLLRAAFLGAASGYTLARLGPDDVPELVRLMTCHVLRRTARALERSGQLEAAEARNLLDHHLANERAAVASIDRLAPMDADDRRRAAELLDHLEQLIAGQRLASEPSPGAEEDTRVCRRLPDPKGPLWAFGYSYFEDHLERQGLRRPKLLDFQDLWGEGSEYAYEVLNLVDGGRSVAAVRDAVAAIYGPVPTELVAGYLDTLERIGVVRCASASDEGLVGAAGWSAALTGPLAERARGFQTPDDPVELGLAGYAKVLCSAVFVSRRDPDEARRNSAFLFLPEAARDQISAVAVDREAREVRVTWRGRGRGRETTRTARFFGDQGCIALPAGADGVFFEPVAVRTTLPDSPSLPWPMCDRLRDEPLAPEIDEARLAAAVDAAFADPEGLTTAFLVVYKGRVLAERYDLGADRHTQLESWSMGKSLTATLIGVLVQDGAFAPEDPAPVPAWRGDARSEIRIVDLLRMSSGLHFVAPRDPDYTPQEHGYPDHMYIYTGAINAFEYAISRPLQFPPNTVGRYRNSDPLALSYVVRETVRARGEEYLTFPQRALFDRIGIRRQVLETDPWGNFELTGYDYGTARNWARLGLLYLWDGVWQGERILPAGWAELISTPAPAWDQPAYGGLFWLNRTGMFPALPEDAYAMAGAGGQRVIIVPSLDLVVVRLGHLRGGGRGTRLLNDALEHLAAAIDQSS